MTNVIAKAIIPGLVAVGSALAGLSGSSPLPQTGMPAWDAGIAVATTIAAAASTSAIIPQSWQRSLGWLATCINALGCNWGSAKNGV